MILSSLESGLGGWYIRPVMHVAAPRRDTVERVKALLRCDLKLGQDAVLEDETPLMGGEYDLDSLDVLLLVTSVEKEFGIKILPESNPLHNDSRAESVRPPDGHVCKAMIAKWLSTA